MQEHSSRRTGATRHRGLPLEDLLKAALETKPMTPEEKKKLEEEYRQRERAKPGRKKAAD